MQMPLTVWIVDFTFNTAVFKKMYRCHCSTKTNCSKLTETDIYVVVFILYMIH